MNITQNAAINLPVWMPTVDDGRVGATGLTLTVNLKKNGGAFADVTSACTIVERGNGWYDVTHTAGHIDTLGVLDRRITATGATERNQQYMVQVEPAKESTLLALLGTGDTAVDHNTGADGSYSEDYLRALYSGNAVDNAVIEAYQCTLAQYNAGSRGLSKGRSKTKTDGRWLQPLYLDSGFTYTIVFYKQGAFNATAKEITI